MDGSTVAISHLIKLVNAADALVAEHQRATLQGHLPSQGVLHHRRRQAHSARPAASRVLAPTHTNIIRHMRTRINIHVQKIRSDSQMRQYRPN